MNHMIDEIEPTSYKLKKHWCEKEEQETEKPFNLDAAIRFWDNLDIDRLHDINTLKLD